MVINSGATLKFSRGSDKSFFDVLSGSGGVVIANSNNAIVRLVSNNTYTGLTTISSGTLMIGQGNPNQPGSIVSNVVNNSSLVFNRVENLTYAGSISGIGTVTKQAAGKLILTGSNTYTGITNITAGTLITGNSAGSATGTGPVNVASGATLGGTGSLAGSVTLASGAHLSPGTASVGDLTTGALTLAPGCFLDYELASPGTGDLAVISNPTGLTLGGGILNIISLTGFGVGQYALLDYVTSFTGSASNLAIASAPPGFVYSFVDNPNNTSIDLVVSIPEPAMASFFPIIALALLLRRRREELPARANLTRFKKGSGEYSSGPEVKRVCSGQRSGVSAQIRECRQNNLPGLWDKHRHGPGESIGRRGWIDAASSARTEARWICFAW